jgi:hypothetical protein
MKIKLTFLLLAMVFMGQAQGNKADRWNDAQPKDAIQMTWNKNTPESEMNEDIKALSEHGVTLSYSDIKRNDKGEITGIKVTYSATDGSNGSLALDNTKPINTIKFYKQEDEMGFGEPTQTDFMNGLALGDGFNPNDHLQGFQFNEDKDALPGQQFHYEFPNGNSFSGQSSAKVIIQNPGKKPLVMENGTIVEGGDDYTKEELEEIKKNNKVEMYQGNEMPNLDFGGNGMGNLAEQMKQMQEQMNQLMQQQQQAFGNPTPKAKSKKEKANSKKELEQAKEEMKQAKKELENAKQELEKAKSSVKMQKA